MCKHETNSCLLVLVLFAPRIYIYIYIYMHFIRFSTWPFLIWEYDVTVSVTNSTLRNVVDDTDS